jgi:serine/threonine-protein kinase
MKPEHIILQGDRVRLIDFGISIRKSEADLARPFGTKSWAAPEQLNGSTLDERCDVYSVGRIIEYMQKNSYAKDDYKIKKILAQATEENVIERTSSITVLKNQLAELNDKNYKSRTKGNLDKRIAVVGSHPSVGTTMIAIRMCRYLNRKGACAFYQDVEGDTVHNLLKNLNHTRLKDGILYHEDFKGILNYDEAIEISKPPRGLFIKDCGTNIEKAVDSDFIIFVTSLCPWQSPVYPSWISSESVYVLSNISTKLATIKLAKKLKKKVYMYPRIKSVFKSDIDEERIFSAILKNEKDEYF